MHRSLALLALLGLGLLLIGSMPPPVGIAGIAGYEPLHTFLETIAVVIAALVFAVGWIAHSDEMPARVVLLSCAFLGVALLDFSHALSFAGMPTYVTPSSPEKAIDFWLAARALAALALLATAAGPWRPFRHAATRPVILGVVLTATALAHWLILWHPEVVPRTFVEGQGLTGFKVGAEYALIALYLAAAAVLWLRARGQPQPVEVTALFVAVGTMALSEVFFTLYASVTDIYNLMGHVYKLVAYLFLYRAVFVETVERPRHRLVAAQTQLRTIVETIPDLLFLKDANGVYLDCNPTVERLAGRPRAAIVGRTDHELLPKEVADAFRASDVQAMAGAEPSIQEEWITFPGYRGLYETIKTPVRDANGQVVGVLGIARDITQARRAREAQSVSEQRLAQVVRVARIGIFDHDHLTDTIHWSPEQRDIYGVAADEPITLQVFLRHVFPADLERIAAAVQRAHDPDGDGLFDVEHRILRSDGEIRFLTTRSQTFFEGEGGERHKVRTIGAVVDITERKRAEDERRSLEMQLRESQKMESIGTLAGGIAHDFNNILGAIVGNAALARGDLPPGHPAHESLQQIAKASARARDLIQQILAFSRRQPQERVWQPLRPLVEESLKLLRTTLPARVELQTRLSDAPMVVFGDGTQIQQVLMNLCTNAWHALTDDTGTITVGLDEVRLDAAAARAAGAPAPGRYAHLWVRDTGSGMDAQTRSRIFEPFFTTKPPGRGTGLGLSVVHGIVAAHQGAITVDSAPGQGSTFHLYFPAQTDAQAAPEGAPAPPLDLVGHGEHVLYVDDDEVMVLMVERLLQRAGYRTTCCRTAQDALAALRAAPQSFDAVVTDYNMPGATGLEIAQAVAQMRPGLPVIVSSGYVSEELRAGAARVGARHLLRKEHTFEDLPPLLRRVLAR